MFLSNITLEAKELSCRIFSPRSLVKIKELLMHAGKHGEGNWRSSPLLGTDTWSPAFLNSQLATAAIYLLVGGDNNDDQDEDDVERAPVFDTEHAAEFVSRRGSLVKINFWGLPDFDRDSLTPFLANFHVHVLRVLVSL